MQHWASEQSIAGCIIVSYKDDAKNKKLVNDKDATNNKCVLVRKANENVYLLIIGKL